MNHIEINPAICDGKPVIRGTRILVHTILGMIAGGYTTEKIIEAYPELTKEAIKAAEAYATRMGEGGYARGWTGESLWQRDRSV